MGDFPIGFGRYQLVERLAIGGMAELFVATSPGEHGFQKRVVIKRLLPHLIEDDTYNAMFIDEAKLTARLVHPKIAQTFELGKVSDALYIAMEYVEGIDVLALLREFASRRRRVDTHLAAWIAHEVLDALDYAHNLCDEDGRSLGIVHRDISPSNVLMSVRGDIKLVDFGIARQVDPDRAHKSKTGTLKGKYGYMSPEQVTEQRVDSRSDLFSVGVVLAELLTGRRLFAAANELDVLLMVRDAKLTRFDKYGADIDGDLQNIVRLALKKPTDERWQNAAAFRDALAEWLFENRKRMTPKVVADVVHELRDAVGERRAKQLDGDTAIIESNDKPTVASSPAPPRSPTGDGVPIISIDAGDSMPMISMSYEPAEEPNPARPVTASELAAATAVDKRIPRASSPNAPRAVIPVRGERAPSEIGRAGSDSGITAAAPQPRGTAPVASIPPASIPPASVPPPTQTPVRTPTPAMGTPGHTPTPASGTPTRTTPAAGVRSMTPVGTPARPTPMPQNARTQTSSIISETVRRAVDPTEGIVEVPIADTISAAVERITMPGDDLSEPVLIHAPAEPGAPDLPHIRTRTEDSGIRAFDALTEIPKKRIPTEIPSGAAAPVPNAGGVPPVLADIAEPPDDAGEFATTSPLRVLFRLMTARATGLLVVAIGGIKKEIYVRDGQPEYVSSNVASELFGNYLVAKGVLSDGELAMALAMMPHYGGKLGDTLVGLGLLKPLEVFRHLTRQVRSKIIDVCTWNKGGFGWYAGRENPREAFPLDFNAFEILGAGAMALSDEVTEAWIAKHADARLRASRTRRVGPERFEVKGLVELAESLDGRRTVNDLVESSGSDRQERLRIGRMLCLLEACDLARPT